MAARKNKGPRQRKSGGTPPARGRRLDELIQEAIVDAYDRDEQVAGFQVMLEEHLELPFATRVLGLEVEVERVDLAAAGEIVAVCTRGRFRQKISLLELPLPDPPPPGAEWIEAYRRWASC